MSTTIRYCGETLHKTSLKASDLAPGKCLGCGRGSHTAFCDLCAPPLDGPRSPAPYDRRRGGFLALGDEDAYECPAIRIYGAR